MIRPDSRYRIVRLTGGSGVFEVDFRTYLFTGPTTLFLRPGQYVDILSGDISAVEVPLDSPLPPTGARVLFTHVYEVGRVSSVGDSVSDSTNLERSTRLWHDQKPLHPEQTREQTELVLDLTDLIATTLPEPRSPSALADELSVSHQHLNRVTRKLAGQTVGDLQTHHRLTAAKHLLGLSSRSVKEVSSLVGYSDAAYFSRRFTLQTGESPQAFRDRLQTRTGDPFMAELAASLEQVSDYRSARADLARHFGLDPRSLNAKVKRHTGHSLQHLLRRHRARRAMELLLNECPVAVTAERLGFADAYQFSHFFRREAGFPPGRVQQVQASVTS